MTLNLTDFSPSIQRSLTALGGTSDGVRRAHTQFAAPLGHPGRPSQTREYREGVQDLLLTDGATRARLAGTRAVAEEPDAVRTCFERDLDRVRHSSELRALAGKQQVFLDADGGLRTRLTHSTEVSQIATAVAQAVGANVDLAAAAGLAHDVGHTPCGHDGEAAFSPFVPGGFDHAVYGADVVVVPLNLCTQTLDAVRHHSWRLGAPATPEAEIVSWADRVAYTTSDFQDAVRAGVVAPQDLPVQVRDLVGVRASRQIDAFIRSLVTGTLQSGVVGMLEEHAQALDIFRHFNYDRIYLRPAARVQAARAIHLLTELVEFHTERPALTLSGPALAPAGSPAAAAAAVRHVAAMTDRQVLGAGVSVLGWSPSALPRGA
jgi:dGTPase